jgi:sterol desaturase/sphingolipid hydroxylase (fatty acid hydroxylase superfamily)
MIILAHPAPFILLATLFGLQAQNIFLINRLLDSIREFYSEPGKVKKKEKAKVIIKCLNFIVFICFIGMFLLLARIATSSLNQESQNINYLDSLIVTAFVVITMSMFVTFLISTFKTTSA